MKMSIKRKVTLQKTVGCRRVTHYYKSLILQVPIFKTEGIQQIYAYKFSESMHYTTPTVIAAAKTIAFQNVEIQNILDALNKKKFPFTNTLCNFASVKKVTCPLGKYWAFILFFC